jgi:flagellar motor switch protein FliM
VSQPSASVSVRAPGRVTRRSKGAGPQPYDFRRPTKFSREHARALQLTYETFARQYTTLLTSTLRVVAQVTLLSVEQQSYLEYVTALGNPTILAMVTLEPLPGTALLELPLETALSCIDHMLGGPGGEQPKRQLSDIETPLLRGLLERVLGELRYSFEQITAVNPRLHGLEYNPQFAQAAAPSDAMVVASFEMKLGNQESLSTVCLPLPAVIQALAREDDAVALTAVERYARQIALRNLTACMLQAPVPIVVRFGSVRMPPEKIVALEPGDVLSLRHPVNRPLTLSTAGITLAHAVPGNQGARLACLIVDSPIEEAKS